MNIETKDIAAYVDGLPNICGSEELVAEAMSRKGPPTKKPYNTRM